MHPNDKIINNIILFTDWCVNALDTYFRMGIFMENQVTSADHNEATASFGTSGGKNMYRQVSCFTWLRFIIVIKLLSIIGV